ncbi:MAG: LysM peptidoglycan-binding domain-containing protein [Chloroflexota bacterium]
MNPKRFLVLFALACLALIGLWLPANAAPAGQLQQYATPTAGADGRIIYIVQPGDTCIKISLLNNISIDQLRALNSNLDADCVVVEGQPLLLGLVGPALASETPGPSPTPLPPTLTPTPFTGTTEICVLLFDDQDGNALRQETEPALAGGAVSVTETNGKYSATLDTVLNPDLEAYQGICFTNVPAGHYNVSVAIPPNYNPTMDLAYVLDVKAGDRAFIDFGAQSAQNTIAEEPVEDTQEGSPLSFMGILGAVMLVGSIGLAWYAWRMGRPDSKFSGGSSLYNKKD